MNDSTFRTTIGEYLALVASLGFEKVLEEPFVGCPAHASDSKPEFCDEKFFIFAHRDGMLLVFHTCYGETINSAEVYYNWSWKYPNYSDMRNYFVAARNRRRPKLALWKSRCSRIFGRKDCFTSSAWFIYSSMEPNPGYAICDLYGLESRAEQNRDV